MGVTQTTFLLEFGDAFRKVFGDGTAWAGGQAKNNTGELTNTPSRKA